MDKINNFKNRLLGRSNTVSGTSSKTNPMKTDNNQTTSPSFQQPRPSTQRQQAQTWTDIPLDQPPQPFQAHRLQGPTPGPQAAELAAAKDSPRRRAATANQPLVPPPPLNARRLLSELDDDPRKPVVAPKLSAEFLLPHGRHRAQTGRTPASADRGPAIERPATAKGNLKRLVSFSKYRDRFRERKDEQVRGVESNLDSSTDERFQGAQVIRTPSDAFPEGLTPSHRSEWTATNHTHDSSRALGTSVLRPKPTARDHVWTTAQGSTPTEQRGSLDKPLPDLPPEAHLGSRWRAK